MGNPGFEGGSSTAIRDVEEVSACLVLCTILWKFENPCWRTHCLPTTPIRVFIAQLNLQHWCLHLQIWKGRPISWWETAMMVKQILVYFWVSMNSGWWWILDMNQCTEFLSQTGSNGKNENILQAKTPRLTSWGRRGFSRKEYSRKPIPGPNSKLSNSANIWWICNELKIRSELGHIARPVSPT